jgi:hypothetical protein
VALDSEGRQNFRELLAGRGNLAHSMRRHAAGVTWHKIKIPSHTLLSITDNDELVSGNRMNAAQVGIHGQVTSETGERFQLLGKLARHDPPWQQRDGREVRLPTRSFRALTLARSRAGVAIASRALALRGDSRGAKPVRRNPHHLA